jgi:hypothetical protein
MKPFQGEAIKPCVDALIEAFELKAGDVIEHQQIAEVAKTKYRTNRYGGIVVAWRKRLLREQNLDLQVITGYGYRVLDDNERVSVGVKDFTHSVRKMGRSAERIARADNAKLDDHHRRQQDHAVRLTQEIVQSGRTAARQIGFAGRVVSLPRKNKDEAA